MNTKKEIGAAFKERLKEINDTPDLFVWTNIKAELNKEKRKNRWLNTIIVLIPLCIILYYSQNTQKVTLPKNKLNKNKHPNNLKIEESNLTIFIKNKSKKLNKNNTSQTKQKVNNHNKLQKNSANNLNIEVDELNAFTKKKSENNNSKIPSSIEKNLINEKKILTNIIKKDNLKKIIKKDTLEFHSKKTAKYLKLPFARGVNAYKNNFIFPLKTNKIINKKDSIKKSILNITANFGLNYFNSPSNINKVYGNKLGENTTKTSLSFNYGIYFSFDINKKTSIRLGVQRLNVKNGIYGITVNDINTHISTIFTESETVSKSNNNEIITFIAQNNSFDLIQKITYLEVPLEIKQRIIDKNYKLDIIAGYSLFFLEKNNIYINTNKKEKLLIGYNNSLSNRNVSLNIGFSSELSLFKNIFLNFDISYKQHLNLQENNSKNNPFTLNIQSGIMYKF